MRAGIKSIRYIAPMSLAAAALSFTSGCQTHGPINGMGDGDRESLSLNLASNPTTQSTESNTPFIGHVQKEKQDFYFVLKGRTMVENGVTVEKPYKASLSASYARVYVPGMIGALIRGQLGVAQTTTINAFATSTAFAIVTEPDLTTYVVHIDHKPKESVIVNLAWNNNKTETIDDNGFVVVKPGDLTIAKFTPITDNINLTGLPPEIAKEVNALRAIAKNAGI